MFFLRLIITFITIFVLMLESIFSELGVGIETPIDFISEIFDESGSYSDIYGSLDDDFVGDSWAFEYGFEHGTADTPEGKTIVISIFASEPTYKWDFESAEDREKIANINKYLGIAGDYIEGVASDYGKEAEFVTDFVENPDLMYETKFKTSLANTDFVDEPAWEYIDSYVSSEQLKEKYNADNIIYFIMINSDKNSEAVSCTRNWYTGMRYPYEVVYLYNVDYGETNPPAVYAHEMLHTFGAPDLYQSSKEYAIDKDFVSFIEENYPNEIMLTCSDYETGYYDYDKVTNEVTDLTAYYIGLIDYCDIVDEYNLAYSEHDEKFYNNEYGW